MQTRHARSNIYCSKVLWCPGLLVLWAAGHRAVAQSPVAYVDLMSAQQDVARLAPPPRPLSAEVAFQVDDGLSVSIQIVATVGDLATSITAPQGQVLDEANIESYGGTFATFGDTETPAGSFLNPVFMPGFNYWYTFPSLGAGTYTVNFEADEQLPEDVPVLVTCWQESPVHTAVLSNQRVLTLGSEAVVTAAVFEDTAPVSGAIVTASVVRPNASTLDVTLLDSGAYPDYQQSDGLYAAVFNVLQTGEYLVMVEITGTTSQATPFKRHNRLALEVVQAAASLPATLNDYGEDDNQNGLFERLVLEAQDVDVSVECHAGAAPGSPVIHQVQKVVSLLVDRLNHIRGAAAELRRVERIGEGRMTADGGWNRAFDHTAVQRG